MTALLNKLQNMLDQTRRVDFIAPLLLRLYLAPVFFEAGINKVNSFDSIVGWFGSLGLPAPWLMTILAIAAELGGSIFLLFGFATRWISIPLIFTMLVAIFTVHLSHGWLAIAGGGLLSTERTEGALRRLDRAKSILQEHGNYEWLTEMGNFAVLNNGIEFAATYICMLLVLLFIGGGRFVSLDYWIQQKFRVLNP